MGPVEQALLANMQVSLGGDFFSDNMQKVP